ncbi:MAG TPA: RHS repeat-associated core domain-containing protein, partial [Paludibacter sp.]|nr:RHS repeat-associated core domain-containing protein [Paludibacter sp.]
MPRDEIARQRGRYAELTRQLRYAEQSEPYLERQRIHATGDSISTENIYDKTTGLLQSIVRNGETTVYTYDGQHRVSSIEITDKHKQSFVYDNWDRVTSTTEVIGDKTFTTSRSYDDFGRISRETFPSKYYTENKYDKYSNLIEVTDSKNRNIRTLLEENAKGQTVRVSKGGKETTYGYNALGLTTSIVANNVINLGYSYDPNFNLDERTETHDGVAWKEKMHYDPFNRLNSWTVYKDGLSQQSFSMSYDDGQGDLGNILTKSSIINGTMLYGGQKPVNYSAPSIVPGPHAISGIKDVLNTNNSIPTNNLSVTYTDFKKIATLSEGNKYYELTYGVDDERRKSVYQVDGNTQLTRYYQGNYEQEVDGSGNTREIHYLSGAIYIVSTTASGAKTENFYYSYTDFQGSLTALVNADNGTIERYAYDPWGARRDPNDWTKKDSRTSWTVNRGYTGHEHLDAFGIINMNGRVYDPATAQFFSPDPALDGSNWVNYNRYLYCNGNPYKYTDPSGNNPLLIAMGIGALVGGVINWWTHGHEFSWRGLGYFGAGAVVGALSALGGAAGAGAVAGVSGLAAGVGVGAFTGAVIGTGTSLLLNGFNNVLSGGNFGDNFAQSFWSGMLSGAISGGISGGIVGYNNALKQGMNVWWGNKTEWDPLAYDFGYSNPQIQQFTGKNACVDNTIENIEISRWKNTGMGQKVRDIISPKSNPELDPLKVGEAFDKYAKLSGAAKIGAVA